MIGTLISTITGLGAGLFKSYIENKKKDAEHKRTLELEREITVREKQRFEAQERLKDKENSAVMFSAVTKASAETTISAHRHDESIKAEGNIWNVLLSLYRGSVRPTTTYLFNLLYIWAIIFFAKAVIVIFNQMPADNATYQMYKDFFLTILNKDFWVIFGGILGFWFGQRTKEKG
jgi:hypothetical protein